MSEQQTGNDSVHQRFVNVFADFAEKHSSMTKENLDALEKEKENILQALNFAFDAKDDANLKQVLRIAQAIGKHPGGLLEARGYWTDALRCYEKARNAASQLGLKQEEVIFSYYAGIILKKRGNFTDAEKNLIRAYEVLKEENGLSEKFSDVAHELGMMALEKGNFDECKRIHLENLELRDKIDYTLGVAHSKHELGKLARYEGDYPAAKKYLEQSLEISKDFRNDLRTKLATFHELGATELDQAIRNHRFKSYKEAQPHYKQAKFYFEHALKSQRKLGDKLAISNTLYEMGRRGGYMSRFVPAKKYLAENLEIREQLLDEYGVSQALLAQARLEVQIALSKIKRGNKSEAEYRLIEAETLLKQSKEIKEKLGKSFNKAPCLYWEGIIEKIRGDFKQAIDYLEQSYTTWKKIGFWQYQLAEFELLQLNTKK